MRRRTGLDANQARRQLLKKRQNITPLELTANNNIAIRIDAVNLKNRLGDIETGGGDRLHSPGSSESWGALTAHPLKALSCRGGAVHSISCGHFSDKPTKFM